MKTQILLSLLACTASVLADSTIAPDARHAYAANFGWIDARAGAGQPGAVIGEYVCSGYLYAANGGWISLGNGAPTNAIHYSNTSDTDFGVNHLGDGRLRGLAWAANLGWLNFEANGNPRVDLITGQLSGHVWSANAGWIQLTGLRVTQIPGGPDTDGDGLPDAWELQHAPNLTTLGGGDADGDGVPDAAEYLADTNPLNAQSNFKITRLSKLPNVNSVELEWTSSPTRVYDLEGKVDLTEASWLSLGTVPGMAGGSTVQAIEAGSPQTFFRVGAKLPLRP